jgi:polar amino acid transport system substrate-binding protein
MDRSQTSQSATSFAHVISRAAVLACVVIFFGGSHFVSAQLAPLRLVSTAWPPFTNAPGQPRFALDLVEEALGRFGMKANTTIVGAPEFTTALLGGQYDGSAAAWKDPDRERALIFSQPYLENRLVLVGRRGADVSAKTLSELTGKRVAIVDGYSYGGAVDLGGPVFVRSRSEEDSLSQLLKGAVDYTLMDDLVVQYILNNYPKESEARLQIGSTPLVRRDLYLAIRRTRSDAETIVARFNAQLHGMIADRTYHRLLHVDWIRADVNGDGIAENVPSSDRLGPSQPLRIYSLTSPPDTKSETSTKPGFYLGGTIYEDWASVPESYKDVNPQYPDPRRSTASIFKFSW